MLVEPPHSPKGAKHGVANSSKRYTELRGLLDYKLIIIIITINIFKGLNINYYICIYEDTSVHIKLMKFL